MTAAERNKITSEQLLRLHYGAISSERAKVGRPGSYAHNIISTTLRIIRKEFGIEAANKAVRDPGLIRLGWKEEEARS